MLGKCFSCLYRRSLVATVTESTCPFNLTVNNERRYLLNTQTSESVKLLNSSQKEDFHLLALHPASPELQELTFDVLF